MNNEQEEDLVSDHSFTQMCEECGEIEWFIKSTPEAHAKELECKNCGHAMPYNTYKDQDVQTYVDDFDIRWNDMQLPINSELFDDWSLSKYHEDAGPGLRVSFYIHYVPDNKWRGFLAWHFPMSRRKRSDIKTVEGQEIHMRHQWQKHMTRAISYRGRIYIKQSAHRDRALLLHELGHTVSFLEHTEVWDPGIMNPMSPMWLVDGENTR